MIYDAHCHLDLMDNMSGIITEMQNSDISLFAVGTTPKAYDREVQFCRNAPHIKVGLGMHPQLISSGYDDMRLFKALFERSHYIGEVGLDFSKEYIQTKEIQIHAFRDIVKLCEQCGEKVVSVHSLKSANTVIEILREYKTQRSNKYIFHWFTGTIPQLEKAIELGCYFSINSSMLKTKSGLEVINAVPVERMLLETDAPFTFKVQHIEEIEKDLRRLVLKISEIVKMDMTDVFYENFREVFRY
mgnify:FL=1